LILKALEDEDDDFHILTSIVTIDSPILQSVLVLKMIFSMQKLIWTQLPCISQWLAADSAGFQSALFCTHRIECPWVFCRCYLLLQLSRVSPERFWNLSSLKCKIQCPPCFLFDKTHRKIKYKLKGNPPSWGMLLKNILKQITPFQTKPEQIFVSFLTLSNLHCLPETLIWSFVWQTLNLFAKGESKIIIQQTK